MPTLLDVIGEIKSTAEFIAAGKDRPRAELFAESQLADKLQELFDNVAKAVLFNLAATSTLANDTTRRMILLPFENALADLASLVADDAVEAAQRGRNQVIDTLRKQGIPLSFSDMPQTVLDRVAESTFTASQQTMRRLVGDVRISLEQGFTEGLGTKDVAVLLEDQFENMRKYELRRVARTELQSFQNVGAQQTMHDLGVSYQQWRSARDARVRRSHQRVHGEITTLDGKFSNKLRYPLDSSGPPEEWINCRCRAIPFLIPKGKAAPPFEPFRESDLVPVEEAA